MKRKVYNDNGNITLGMIILIIGAVLLFRKMGIFIPGWFLSWPMIFIAIGIITLIKHNFQSGLGAFFLLFGSFFLLKREFNLPFEVEQYLVPVGLIVLGLFIMLKRKNSKVYEFPEWNNPKNPQKSGSGNIFGEQKPQDPKGKSSGTSYYDSGDVINSQAVFCGIQKRVLSKNFKGGKASAIFGGTEIDLTQADLGENAVLEVEVAFGGLKLILPAHWDLQINVTNIFAGIEDKRMFSQTATDPTKVLRIHGTIIFGGLDIKSF